MKLIQFVSKSVNRGFGVVFLFLISVSLIRFAIKSSQYTSFFMPVLIAAMAGIVVGILFCLKRAEKYLADAALKNPSLHKRIFIALPLILLTVQIIFACSIDFTPKNDLSYICSAAENYLRLGPEHIYDDLPEYHQTYFSIYPNNHCIFMIVLGLYKISYSVTGEISNTLPIALNIAALNISFILMCMTARIMYKPEKAVICALRGLMFTPLLTYVCIFYTDTIAMPFITGAIYLYVKFRHIRPENNSILKSTSLIVMLGLLIAVGYKIKGNAVILLAAILIDMILRRRRSITEKLLYIVILAVVFVLVTAIISNAALKVLNISPEELELHKFPLVHWIMMSADGRGGYQAQDYYYTKSFEGYDAKISADLSRLGEKIKSQGFFGFMAHLVNKLAYTWGDGSFMQAYYNDCGKVFNGIVIYISQIFHFTLLTKMAESFIKRRNAPVDACTDAFFLKMCLAGLTLFLLIWEARCRYLINFFALFALI